MNAKMVSCNIRTRRSWHRGSGFSVNAAREYRMGLSALQAARGYMVIQYRRIHTD